MKLFPRRKAWLPHRMLADLHSLAKAGLAVFAFGSILDLWAHWALVSSRPASSGGFTPFESVAHLVVFAGMVLTLAGVVASGLHRRTSSERGKHTTDSSDYLLNEPTETGNIHRREASHAHR